MKQKLPERRRFVRIETPLKVTVKLGDYSEDVITKNVSPVGLRFEVKKNLKAGDIVDLFLHIPSAKTPISLTGKVVWASRKSLEDRSPYDIGIEIIDIGDESKNIFLRYICNLLYDSTYKVRT